MWLKYMGYGKHWILYLKKKKRKKKQQQKWRRKWKAQHFSGSLYYHCGKRRYRLLDLIKKWVYDGKINDSSLDMNGIELKNEFITTFFIFTNVIVMIYLVRDSQYLWFSMMIYFYSEWTFIMWKCGNSNSINLSSENRIGDRDIL